MDKPIYKILQIVLLLIIFTTDSFGQHMPFYLKASSPEYILPGNEIDASILLRIFNFNADIIVFHVLTTDAVNLNSVKVNGIQKKFELNNSDRFSRKCFDIKFDLNDEQLNYESLLNITLTLLSRKSESSEVDFEVDYIKNGEITNTYTDVDFDNFKDHPIHNIYLDFYKPQSIAGKSILLRQGSEVKFSFNYRREVSDFLIEFWGRFEKPSKKFLSFLNSERNDTVIALDINRNKVLSTSKIDKISFVKDYFISRNSWYHVAVFININKSSADIFVNNEKTLSVQLKDVIASGKFALLFDKSTDGIIEIDQLKVWEYKNSPRLCLANKNYESYAADSSRLFLRSDFNDENRIRNFNSTNASISFKNISFTKSTAPIFSRAPDLNVYLYNDFYQIEWNNTSINDADFYELEKSEDGTKFRKIFETFASDDPEKVYYFSDPKDKRTDVIYYRVRQINKDGSVVYSSNLKIGQGEIKLFSLGNNYPNPFNPSTNISIEILEPVDVDIYVYDIVGEKVAVLNKGVLSQGIHSFTFDGSSLPSGIYFCEAKSAKYTDVKKMILAK